MVNQKKLISTFIDLVKIDSPSGEETRVAKHIIEYLKKLKIKARQDKYGNVVAQIPGHGQPLLLVAHMDTVEPGRNIKPLVKGDIIKTDGTTILGADDKAGIAAILEAVRCLIENKTSHLPLELVFTRREESDLSGAANLNYKTLSAKKGLVIDSDGPLGHINIAAPFIYHIDIKIIGRSAHAGAEPEKGINAIQIASQAISALKIGRINRITTNNIGMIQGGSAVNAVPETVVIKAEARSQILAEAQLQVDLINKAFKKSVRRYGAKLLFKAKLGCRGYSYPINDKFIKDIAALNKKMGFKTVYEASGGASDANVFAGQKIKIIDISYGGSGCHTTRESIRSNELVNLARFLVEFVKA